MAVGLEIRACACRKLLGPGRRVYGPADALDIEVGEELRVPRRHRRTAAHWVPATRSARPLRIEGADRRGPAGTAQLARLLRSAIRTADLPPTRNLHLGRPVRRNAVAQGR